MKIKKRWLLVVLISSTQLATMLLSVMYFADWIEQEFKSFARGQVFDNDKYIVSEIANDLENFSLKNLDQDSETREKIQDFVSTRKLPEDGYAMIFDLESGNVVFHPRMNKDPRIADLRLGRNVLETEIGSKIIGEVVNQSPADEIWSGQTQLNSQSALVSIKKLSDSRHAVCVVHSETELSSSIFNLIQLMRQIGFGITLLIGLVSTSLIVVVLQRYDSRNTEQKSQLEQIVDERSDSLMKTKNAIIFGLAKLAESRDTDTGEHLERIRRYVTILAKHLKEYDPRIDDEYIANIGVASSLHDIGKVGIPDAILLKPGSLTQDERFVMEQHTVIGGECLDAIQSKLGEDTFLEMARKITYSHHERWDGTGYPYRFAGEDIPLEARIVSVADVYDALTTKRPYKKAMSHEESKSIIMAGTGTQFDPQIVEAFVAKEEEFRAIAESQRGVEMPAIMALESTVGTVPTTPTTTS